MIKLDSFQSHQDDSTYANQCDMPHQQNTQTTLSQ